MLREQEEIEEDGSKDTTLLDATFDVKEFGCAAFILCDGLHIVVECD